MPRAYISCLSGAVKRKKKKKQDEVASQLAGCMDKFVKIELKKLLKSKIFKTHLPILLIKLLN